MSASTSHTENTGLEEDVSSTDSVNNENTTKQRPPAKSTSEKKKLVQMRLNSSTLDRIENMSKMTGITNRTHLVTSSIQIAELIMEEANNGAVISLKRPDGTTRELTIVGI